MRKLGKIQIPICEKLNLTIEEAAVYSNIGENRIRTLITQPGCNFVLHIGNKKLIKRRLFDKYIEAASYI